MKASYECRGEWRRTLLIRLFQRFVCRAILEWDNELQGRPNICHCADFHVDEANVQPGLSNYISCEGGGHA